MKLLQIDIDRLNNYLARDYGYFEGVHPNFRIVWSHDEFEKRKSNYSDEGIELLFPVIKEVPKYRQWCDERYVLERVIPIPAELETDQINKFSYEPIWVFQDGQNNFLPPNYDVCKIIIYSLYHQMHASVGARYSDPRMDKDWAAMNEEAFKQRYKEMFGNETALTDALSVGEAVGYGPKGGVN
jgi:hypothetical protein